MRIAKCESEKRALNAGILGSQCLCSNSFLLMCNVPGSTSARLAGRIPESGCGESARRCAHGGSDTELGTAGCDARGEEDQDGEVVTVSGWEEPCLRKRDDGVWLVVTLRGEVLTGVSYFPEGKFVWIIELSAKGEGFEIGVFLGRSIVLVLVTVLGDVEMPRKNLRWV